MDKIFRRTKVTEFSDGDENFVRRNILSDKALWVSVSLLFIPHAKWYNLHRSR